MGRNLIDVIEKMITCIPIKESKKQRCLIDSFRDIQDSQRCRAPEDMLGWQLVSEELQNLDLNKKSPKWQKEMCSIFSTIPVEEIEKELK